MGESRSRDDTAAATGAGEGFTDPTRWREFQAALAQHPLDPGATERVALAWLELLCSDLEGVSSGLVSTRDPGGRFRTRAHWPSGLASVPDDDAGRDLKTACDAALEAAKGVAVTGRQRGVGSEVVRPVRLLAYPLQSDKGVEGVVGIETAVADDRRLQLVMRRLQWGMSWLERWLERGRASSGDRTLVTELLAICLESPTSRAALLAVGTELATRLGMDRVAIGFLKGRHSRLESLSHSADFAPRSNLVRRFEALMDEAVDQQGLVVWPRPEQRIQVDREHGRFVDEQGSGLLVTVPLVVAGEIIGALVLERAAPEPAVGEPLLETCRHLGAFLAPALYRQRQADRGPLAVSLDAGRTLLKRLFGPDHPTLKLVALLLVGLLLFSLFATGTWRVTADAVIEGSVRRVVTAPIDGFVLESLQRPGDLIAAGDLLARLDDRELRLERARWASQRLQRQREYEQAMAERERARVRILGAALEQADAQLDLIDAQLARTRLQAPFDGVVVTGDLSQSLGAPVSRGDVLFEIAPLEDYRVILKIDERDVSAIRAQQRGELVLAGLPSQTFAFTVERVTPVSRTEGGTNYFRAEALLASEVPELRPGMEGIAKVDVEPRRLIWIWTHRAVNWLRLTLWTWIG